MKKIYLLVVSTMVLLFNSCLDVDPVSEITDKNYWKTSEHFDAFMYGMHSRFRTHAWNFNLMGEARSDIYGDMPFGGEASQGMERFPYNTLNEENVGISNYGGFYSNINQINLFIKKANETQVLGDTEKNFYLGQAYAMRAYYFFHLYRTWGAAVYTEEPSEGFDVGALDRAAEPKEEILNKIKADIGASEKAFGSNYDFILSGKKDLDKKTLWSKPALLMLKAEVYLWIAHESKSQPDVTIAKNALSEIRDKTTNLGLMDNFSEVFDYDKKGNKEIIFAIRDKVNEHALFNGSYKYNLLPGDLYINKYLNEDGTPIDIKVENNFGLMRLQIKMTNFLKFDTKDSRRNATIKGVYDKEGTGIKLVGTYPKKYPGTMDGSVRSASDDYPIYRYADLLLMLAEVKHLLGEDPSTEINDVRKRAYGANYSSSVAFPNQPEDNDVKEAILKERFFEFMVEGKRWYDLRRFGNEYIFKYTTADSNKPLRLYWPIDKGTLTKNPKLNQTPGYIN